MRVPSKRSILGAAIVAAVCVAVAVGLVMVGPPSETRARRLDERRMQDLESLSSLVDVYWAREHRLPASEDDLARVMGRVADLRDPTTNTPYELRAIDSRRYQLCAEFDRSSDTTALSRPHVFWSHRAGRQCFELEPQEVGKPR
jgi:hypothetical protein